MRPNMEFKLIGGKFDGETVKLTGPRPTPENLFVPIGDLQNAEIRHPRDGTMFKPIRVEHYELREMWVDKTEKMITAYVQAGLSSSDAILMCVSAYTGHPNPKPPPLEIGGKRLESGAPFPNFHEKDQDNG